MILNRVSSKAVISKVYRDLNLKEENRWEDMVEWIGEAFEHIGYFDQFEEKTDNITVESFRGRMPCGIHQIIQTKYVEAPMHYNPSTFRSYYHVDNSVDYASHGNATYHVDPPWIKTSFEEGEFLLSYLAIPVDEEGFPMIPDEVSYKEACFWYITMKLMLGGFVHPNREITYGFAEQRWHHYCGQSRAKGFMPDIGKMELIRKTLVRLIPQISAGRTFFTENLNDDGVLRRE